MMFCPQCGTNETEDLKFCKSCGANLFAVRKAISFRDTDEKFDWRKTWVADMMLSQEERQNREQARKEKLERERGETAEVKRYSEIKNGVITSCVGLGVMFFLYMLFEGIIASGFVAPSVAAILRVIWAAGAIPFVVGVGLVFNGAVVGKKHVETAKRLRSSFGAKPLGPAATTDPSLSSADWSEPPEFGVTENTTRELR